MNINQFRFLSDSNSFKKETQGTGTCFTETNHIRTLLHSQTAKKPNSRVNGSIKPL